jgi:hypothetical protein
MNSAAKELNCGRARKKVPYRSKMMRSKVARILVPATKVPRKVPETFDRPPVRQR